MFASENGFGVVGYANVAIRNLFCMIKIMISIMFVNLFIIRSYVHTSDLIKMFFFRIKVYLNLHSLDS